MIEATKAKITIEIQDKIIDILVPEADAFGVLDTLLGRTRRSIIPSLKLPTPTLPEKEKAELKVPSRERLEEFIKSQPDYKFSVEAIVQHFLKRSASEFNSVDELKFLSALRAKINRIRQAIEKSEKVEWVVEQKGHQKIFSVKKNDGDEIKKSTKEQLTVENY